MCDLLPDGDRDLVRGRLRAAWAMTDAELAERQLELLAAELDRSWPDAARSLREGLTETLTLMHRDANTLPRRCARPTHASR